MLLLAAATTPGWPVLCALLVAAGAAEGMVFTATLLVRHREAPSGARSNVHTTAASLKLAAFAAGAASGAFLTGGASLLLAAGVVHVGAAAAVAAPTFRRTMRVERH